MNPVVSPQDALVAIMLTTSAADERLSTIELLSITRIIDHLPAFQDYEHERIRMVSGWVFEMMEVDDGLDAIIGLAKDALPDGFNETAYALACDVAAADGSVPMTESHWLQILRQELAVGRLPAAAIERAARARHLRLPGQEPGQPAQG